jgi:hypothetical protein
MFEEAWKSTPFKAHRESMCKRIPARSMASMLLGSSMAAREESRNTDRLASFAKGDDRYVVVWTANRNDVTKDEGEVLEKDSLGFYCERAESGDIDGAITRLCDRVNRTEPDAYLIMTVVVSRWDHVAIDAGSLSKENKLRMEAMALAYRALYEFKESNPQKLKEIQSSSVPEVVRMAIQEFGEEALPADLSFLVRRGILCQGLTIDARSAALSLDTKKASELYAKGIGEDSDEFLDEACSFFLDDGQTQEVDLGCDELIPHMMNLSLCIGGNNHG